VDCVFLHRVHREEKTHPQQNEGGPPARRRTVILRRMTLHRLFFADEAGAEGEGAALASGEGAEVGGVEIVYHRVGILAVEDVDGFSAEAPEVAAEAELFFEADVEAGVVGEAGGVRRADELLLKVDEAVGEAGAVLEEIAELDGPDVGGEPAPGD